MQLVLIQTPLNVTTELHDMCFSDFFKDVNGFRPRGSTWDYYIALPAEALEKALDDMDASMEEQFQESYSPESRGYRFYES